MDNDDNSNTCLNLPQGDRKAESQTYKLLLSYFLQFCIYNDPSFCFVRGYIQWRIVTIMTIVLAATFASASSKDRNLNCCIWLDRSYCTLATTIVVFLSLMISDNHDGSCLDVPQAHPKALCGKLGTSYYQCSCASDDGGEDENGYF